MLSGIDLLLEKIKQVFVMLLYATWMSGVSIIGEEDPKPGMQSTIDIQ